MNIVPLRIGLFLSGNLGKLAGRFIARHSNIALSNLKEVFNEDTAFNEKLVGEMFANLAKNGVEWVKLYSMPRSKLGSILNEFEGLHHLDEVMSRGNGALVLGFHFGNWELLGMGLRDKGYPGSLVARRIYFHKYDKLLVKLRMKYDAKTIYRDESPRKMIMELKNGRILGIVPDQDVDSVDGVFVDFFGKKTFTPTAPVKLAMTAKTSVVPVFIVRKSDNTNKMVVERPIDVSNVDKSEENVFNYTQEWTSVLERYVRKYPEQWVWLHRRWKTQPGQMHMPVK